MPKYDNNLEQLIFQIEIHINHKEETFFEIKRSLDKKIGQFINQNRFNEEYPYNYYLFISHSFKKHMSFLGQSRAYIADYREEKGSLVVLFNIIIIGTIVNYGSLRTGIDFFINDLEDITSFALNDNTMNRNSYDVTTNVREESRDSILMNKIQVSKESPFVNKKQFIKSFILLAIVLTLTCLGTYAYFQTELQKNKIDIKLEDIRKIIQEELRNQRIDEYIYKNKELKQPEVPSPKKEVKK